VYCASKSTKLQQILTGKLSKVIVKN